MAASYLIRLGVVKGKSGVLVALKHNKRELQAERGADAHIDVTRTTLNYCLAGDSTPSAIATYAKVQMVKAGIDTPRINGVMAVEVIFSLPIDRHQQDTKPFFADCLAWVKKEFAAAELLSFDVHLDEAAPHAHALILPLMDGKMQGSAMIGNRGDLMRRINQFHKDVAGRYGLSKSDRKRLTSTDKQELEKLVLACLKNDTAKQSSIWPCIRDEIHKNPLPFAQMLDIELTKPAHKASKSFVDIKRSKGKGSFVR